MPTKLARTVASSVCGRVDHCSSVTTTATTAPPTITPPIRRPAIRRARTCSGSSHSAIGLAPEQRHPEDKGDEQREARIDERSRADVGIDAYHDEEPSREDGDDDADRGTEHPRGEERADEVDLRSQGPRRSLGRRARARDVARGERERRRRFEQLDLRIELREPRPTQLTPGSEQIRERAEPQTIRRQRV